MNLFIALRQRFESCSHIRIISIVELLVSEKQVVRSMAAGSEMMLRLLLTYLLVSTTQTQQVGFPAVIDVSRDQQVSSEPSSSVCGLPTVSTFCRSTTSSLSVSECHLASCTSQCPSRTASPAYVDLLLSVTSGTCVVRDHVNVSPHSTVNDFSVLFLLSVALSDPTTCYIRPPVNPTLGADGSFTLTFWVWLNTNANGCVLFTN